MKNARDLEFPAYTGMLHAHEANRVVDEDAIQELQARMTVSEDNASPQALLTTSLFYLNMGKVMKAREFVNKVLEANPNFPGARTLKGWIGLSSGRDNVIGRSGQAFDESLRAAGQANDLEAMLGRAKFLQMTESYNDALEMYNQIVVHFTWFVPALVEKARLLLLMGDWEQAKESAQRVLASDPSNIDGQRVMIVYKLACEADYADAANAVHSLMSALDRHEPRNARLYVQCAQTVARLAARRPDVVRASLALVEKAFKIKPRDSYIATEYGYQHSLLGDNTAALTAFEQASKLDEGNAQAVYGIIRCQLNDGKLDEAGQQLEFLNEIQQSIGRQPELLFLSAQLAWRRAMDSDKSLKALDECLDLHLATCKRIAPGDDIFVAFNADFLLEIAKEYLQHVGLDPTEPGDSASPLLTKGADVLEMIRAKIPANLECLLLLGKCRFIQGQNSEGLRLIQHSLALDSTYAEAHISLAQIYVAQGHTNLAAQSLEQALSHDFGVRDRPVYNLIRARVHEDKGQLQEAVKILDVTLQLPGVRRPIAAGQTAGRGGKKLVPVALHDRVSVYLALARVHMRLNQTIEGSKVMNDAIDEFRGTVEEVRVTIANCEVNLQRGDIESALDVLRRVNSANPYFVKAKTAMANIYLQYRSDRKGYMKCYEEMMQTNVSVQTCRSAADAFMRVGEPEKAISALQDALRLAPDDTSLSSSIGKVLITTHDYQKAVKFYEMAVAKEPTRLSLRHDLAELLIRLRSYSQAEKALNEALAAIDQNRKGDDMLSTMDEVKTYMLLSRLHKGTNRDQASVDALVRARDKQLNVLAKVQIEAPSQSKAQRGVATKICMSLADYYAGLRQHDQALAFYNEALKHDETSERAMIAVARLHLARGELDSCQQQCMALIRVDPGNEAATMMLADVMFRRQDDTATYHFEQLLEKTPNNYVALHNLLVLLRRAGRLDEIPRFLKMAEFSSLRAAVDAGFHFCKGLYEKYCNNPRDALKEFNFARGDAEWGERAVRAMIDIFISPDNENLWEEATDEAGHANIAESIKSAQELLHEIKDKTTVDYRILEANCYLALKSKSNVDTAVATFVDILKADKTNVPALLGLATGQQILKASQKARNFLKTIAKIDYNSDQADEFEKAYLLLAEIYIEGGKYDQAHRLAKLALTHNKSCGKAWELIGKINEHDAAYATAAENYELAFRFSSFRSPATGFRLAFNYLKAKRYVDAINMCHKVLELDPKYPKIRKDILDRARNAVRN